AVLVKWHKADGDTVTADEALCELETDKANVDVPSPAAGVLRRLVQEGQTVKIGDTIARIDEPKVEGNGRDNKSTNPSALPPASVLKPPAPPGDAPPTPPAPQPQRLSP